MGGLRLLAQAQLHRHDGGVGAIGGAQLPDDALDVLLNGDLRQVELLADGPVGLESTASTSPIVTARVGVKVGASWDVADDCVGAIEPGSGDGTSTTGSSGEPRAKMAAMMADNNKHLACLVSIYVYRNGTTYGFIGPIGR